MSQYESYPSAGELGGIPRERVDSRAVFGQVMGLVAFTVAFAAAGAYIGRDLSTGGGWIAFIGASFAARLSSRSAVACISSSVTPGRRTARISPPSSARRHARRLSA